MQGRQRQGTLHSLCGHYATSQGYQDPFAQVNKQYQANDLLAHISTMRSHFVTHKADMSQQRVFVVESFKRFKIRKKNAFQVSFTGTRKDKCFPSHLDQSLSKIRELWSQFVPPKKNPRGLR
jgi:ribosomal protein S15P/S13E